MNISIHPKIKGKPVFDESLPSDELNKIKAQYWGPRKYTWENLEADSFDDVFELITNEGYAVSAELTESPGVRDSEHFKSRQLYPVDIDDGMTLQDLFDNEFYNAYGAGFYASPSFTLEHHKFRILFVTETPLYDENLARLLFRALIHKFNSDQACKDGIRLFFGTPNCSIKENRGKILPDWLVAELVSEQLEREEQDRKQSNSEFKEYKPLNDEQKEKILSLLEQVYVGEYPVWRDIGWGLKAGGFDSRDFERVTRGMMRKKSPIDAHNVWSSGRSDSEITMGTVVWFLRQHYTDDEIFIRSQVNINDDIKTLAHKLTEKYGEEIWKTTI